MHDLIRPSRSKNRFTVTERTSVKLEVSTRTVIEKSTEIEVLVSSNSSSSESSNNSSPESQYQKCLCDIFKTPFTASFEQGNHKNHVSNYESRHLPLSMLAMVENLLYPGKTNVPFSESKNQQESCGGRHEKTQKPGQRSNHLLTCGCGPISAENVSIKNKKYFV